MILSAKAYPSGGGQRFLFELLPDLFPWGYFTEVEHALWHRYDQELEKIVPKGR